MSNMSAQDAQDESDTGDATRDAMAGATGATGAREETLRLDGNAAAGMLADIFMHDMTTAHSTCAHCGHTEPLGALLMYGGQTGNILRCPSCDQIELRIMHISQRGGQQPGQYCLDLRGITLLRIMPASLV